MIDIPSDNVKALHGQIIQSWSRFISRHSKRIFPTLQKPWRDTAEGLDSGIIAIEDNVSRYSRELNEKIRIHYRRVTQSYFDLTLESLQIKSMTDLFTKDTEGIYDAVIDTWIIQQAAQQVTLINGTTRKILKKVIAKGIVDGLTNNEIAKNIRRLSSISNRNRALNIARTETHTAYSKAVDETIRSTNRTMEEKDWSAVGDKRTRGIHLDANGQVVAMQDTFFVGGEPMRYPGDPNGSARNVVLCRCIALYMTVARRYMLQTILGVNHVN